MIRITLFGAILLNVVGCAYSLDNFNVTVFKETKCGQTPCPPPGGCCLDSPNCCCVSSPHGESWTCVEKESHSWSMPWWGNVLIVTAIVTIVASIVFVCYRRKEQRQSYGQI